MRPLELVEAPPLDAAGHMGLDEAILSVAPRGGTVLRFYRWAKPGVTFGYGQRYELAREMARGRGMGSADFIRRATGGGVVFHDGDLTFSVVFPWERLSAPCLIYKNMHRGIHLGLKGVKVESRLWSPSGRNSVGSALEKACFAGVPETMDLVREDGLKILGGALRRRGSMGLYQGSFRPDMLTAPLKTLQQAIADGVQREFHHVSFELKAEWLEEGERLAEKYRRDAWNKKR